MVLPFASSSDKKIYHTPPQESNISLKQAPWPFRCHRITTIGITIMPTSDAKQLLMFTPARSGRSSEDVALQIEAAIVSGKIKPGQGLPSERDMQAQFKTGRGTIREALRALREKGLLEIRKGAKGGAYVRELDVYNVSQPLALLFKQQHVAPEHVVEFRESMDRSITLLALSRASAQARQELIRDAEELRTLALEPDPDLDLLGEMDRDLNLKLGRMAANPVFEWIMAATQQGFSSQDYALYEDPQFREKTAANWVETARQIAANEPLGALSCISNHYVLLRSCLRQRGQEPPDTASGENHEAG